MANLTAKELTALGDQIGQEEILVRKYEALSELCQDAKFKQDFVNFAEKHRQHYNRLVTFLQ